MFRDHAIANDRVSVDGDEIEPPYSELPLRLSEAACARVLTALQHAGHKCAYDIETMWRYVNPLAALVQPGAVK